jgi:GDP-L-fucose synthase
VTDTGSIWVAGHRGLVGSAVVRRLKAGGLGERIVTASRDEVDLTRQSQVEAWLTESRPSQIYLVAGRVGGILANSTRPAEFIYENLMIASTVIHAAHTIGCVDKLLFLGSSCIYPRHAPQPMQEHYLLTGPLEPTNEPYAIAKIAGVRMCQAYKRQYGCNFISGMPTNLYGPGDNFHLTASHVAAALLRRFHEAKLAGDDEVTIWGTGTPLREFMHVDDLADACVFLMDRYDDAETINIGTGEELSIRALAEAIRDVVHPQARLAFDPSKPDGMPRKLLDSSRLHDLGWRPRISLREGLRTTYDWFLSNQERFRR